MVHLPKTSLTISGSACLRMFTDRFLPANSSEGTHCPGSPLLVYLYWISAFAGKLHLKGPETVAGGPVAVSTVVVHPDEVRLPLAEPGASPAM